MKYYQTVAVLMLILSGMINTDCNKTCKQCDSLGVCALCNPGHWLQLDLNSCNRCQDQLCKLCTATECIECEEGYYLKDKRCVEKPAEYGPMTWFLLILALMLAVAVLAFIWNFNKIRIFFRDLWKNDPFKPSKENKVNAMKHYLLNLHHRKNKNATETGNDVSNAALDEEGRNAWVEGLKAVNQKQNAALCKQI